MITIYKYQTEHITAFAAYTDGRLDAIEIQKIEKEPFVRRVEDGYRCLFPILEEQVTILLGHTYTQIDRLTVPAKIRLWCAAYKKYRGTTYSVGTKDKANLAKVQMSEALLSAYFTCTEYWATTNHFDLGTYIREINKVKDLAKNGSAAEQKPKHSFPDTWKPELLRHLQPDQVQAYYKHLRALGFAAKKDGQGRVVKWEKGN